MVVRPMRVVFNGLSAYRPRTGVGSYVAGLLAELQQLAGDGEITAYPTGLLASAASLAGLVLKRKQRIVKIRPASPQARGSAIRRAAVRLARDGTEVMLRRRFRAYCRRGEFDLYHEPNFIPWPADLPTIVTVHDLSVLLHPEWHPPDRVRFHERHFRRGVERCQHVLTDTESVRREVIREIGLPPERVTSIPIGVRSDLTPMSPEVVRTALTRLGVPQEYLLYVGTIEPRKNILTLLKAYCALPSRHRERCSLVLAGSWGWNYAAVRTYFDSTARHRGVIHLGFVSDSDLPALYNGARALVFPSFYEGFGLPPVEMMACGGPVLASTASALREVLGKHAWFIEPADEAGWRDAMQRIIADNDWRAVQCANIVAHARRYSWKRCAEQTWAIYQTIVEAPELNSSRAA
jgi:glycosyltransferase involved in cell wall biosynthesis